MSIVEAYRKGGARLALSRLVPVPMRSTYTRPSMRVVVPHGHVERRQLDNGKEAVIVYALPEDPEFDKYRSDSRQVDFTSPSQRERTRWVQWRGRVWRARTKVLGVVAS